MSAIDLVVRSRRVVRPTGLGPATIRIAGGVIEGVGSWDEVPPDANLADVGDLVVMAGLVDPHVHINDPGRADWEGFETATRAAASGGVTTLVDMPLNSKPVTTSVTALEAKRAAARGKIHVDVGFWGGLIPGNVSHADTLLDAGARGLKAFLCPSGIPDFPESGEAQLRMTLPMLASRRIPLLVHAEIVDDVLPRPETRAMPTTAARRQYLSWLLQRPPAMEERAIALLLRLAREFGARIHVVHLSSATCLPTLDRARKSGLKVSVETCPHYLTFDSEHIPDGATPFKCAPPVRSRENRERLWGGLGEGVIDFVASDHSPCPPAMKALDSGDFLEAWGGIASLGLTLSAVWTEAKPRGHRLERVAEWLCRQPAKFAGLEGKKGDIAPGCDADLVAWDPEATLVPSAEMYLFRHKVSPYTGRRLKGVVQKTWLRGKLVYNAGVFPVSPHGELL